MNYNNPVLTLDSVSFVGSLVQSKMTGSAYIDVVNKNTLISYFPIISDSLTAPKAVVSQASGILAKMYFHLDPAASAGYISIDTIYRKVDVGGGVTLTTQVSASDTLGEYNLYPGSVPGAINVLTPTGVNDHNASGLPKDFVLAQNYPNPFNPSTVIPFSLPVASHVKMEVFNILGQNLATLLDENLAAGNHNVRFDASLYPSGIYFYRWTHGGASETRKMVLVK